MSEIKVGDLVMTIRPMSCGCGVLGYTFEVEKIEIAGSYCEHCGSSDREELIAVLADGSCVELCRLKKIDPPSDELKREVKEELVA